MIRDLVSIIIPVYNSEKYIKRSVGSALAQTYKNIEVVVVDDGSTDTTRVKLNEIKDSRLRVVSSENLGPGAARNTGVEESRGRYILYLDSDDAIDQTTVSRCIEEFIDREIDIVTFDTRIEGESKFFKPDYSRGEKGIYRTKDYLKNNTPCVVWLYFFKRSLVDKENLEFLEGIIHEDRAYTPMLLKAGRKIAYIDEVLHTRYLVEGSIMTRGKTYFNIESKEKVIEYLAKNKIEKNFVHHLWWSLYTDILKIEDRESRKKALLLMQETKRLRNIQK